jgi:hypothetical protein
MEIKYEFDYVSAQTLSKSNSKKMSCKIEAGEATFHVCKPDTGHSTRDTKIKELGPRRLSVSSLGSRVVGLTS